jgi:hypothetical protein
LPFVVVPTRRVNRIMEPQRDGHFVRLIA